MRKCIRGKNMTTDNTYRLATFNYLEQQTAFHGDVLPRITLLGPQGIWKPRVMDIPLSITTPINGPYKDDLNPKGLMEYKYRGEDPNHRDNVGLREAMKQQIPLIYFYALIPGQYLALWPVYIVNDNPASLTFTVAVDDQSVIKNQDHYSASKVADSSEEEYRRKYITTQTTQRLHQHSFRERVLNAYKDHCALCRLKHRELLDAAHIIPDSEPDGIPEVRNGLSLCKIHHTAYDKMIIGITPDYTIEIRSDIMEESDGPMLKHGLQGMNEVKLYTPGNREYKPDKDFLARRYEDFKKAI
jgi:putative restriction endonuclease